MDLTTRARYIALVFLFGSILQTANAQTDTVEVYCDTTVFGHHFTRCISASGRFVAFGNRNAAGQKHGWWCDLQEDGVDRAKGEYRNDHKVGSWWESSSEIWKYDRKGNVISKGKACRDCPTF